MATTVIDNRIYIEIPYSKNGLIKQIPGARWSRDQKKWSVPMAFRKRLESMFGIQPGLDHQIDQAQERKAAVAAIEEEMMQREKVSRGTWDLDRELEGIHVDLSRLTASMQPYEHQIKMIKCGLKWDQWAFFCEMGTGKTKVIVDIIKLREFKRVIILCPKSVITSWTDELDNNEIIDYNVINGSKKQRLNKLDEGASVNILNYDGLLTLKDYSFEDFDCAVLDESSKIKNHDAIRTRLCLKNLCKIHHRYILSGTPITQNPADIYCQLRFLGGPRSAVRDYRSYYAFRNTYCIMDPIYSSKVNGTKNLDELHDRVKRVSIQLKKEDCLDLPEKVYVQRKIDMPDAIEKQYNEMKHNFLIELANGEEVTANIVLTKFLRLQEILAGKYVAKRDNEKLKVLGEIVEEVCIDGGRRLVVFAHFKDSLNMIADLLENMHVPYSRVDGSTEDRDEEIQKFRGGRTSVFIGNIKACCYGLNLQVADTEVYYEGTFSMEERKQSEDRIHRSGQKNTATIIDLLYRNTIDDKVLMKAIRTKQKVATVVVDSFKAGDY